MPNPINPKRLKNKATNYLARYASTEEKLTLILLKYTKKKWPEITIEEALKCVKQTVDWCREKGYVNDYDYMIMKVRAGRSKGQSAKQITQKLFQAGLSKSLVSSALRKDENFVEEEFKAALIMAKKKKLGPFSLIPVSDQTERTRQMARLARAGFNYEICKNVFDYLGET